MGKLVMQVFPPLLLLGLAWVPFSPFVFVFWLAGLACAVVSAVKLVRFGLARVRRKAVDSTSVLRPALTLVVFVAVAAYAREVAGLEAREADGFARATARDVQAACDRDGKCPGAIAGWEALDANRSRTVRAGVRIDYKALPDRSGFRITVVHALEWLRDFEGGVGKRVTENEAIR